MKYFLAPLIIGLLIVAGLNIYIDPSSRWWRSEFNFSGNWKDDEVWVAPLRIEERNLRNRHIPYIPEVELLGLGSSRFLNVDATMFPKSAKFYNSSVTGATVWDYVALWENFKSQGKIPKHIILYLDTWNFNKHTWHKYRWITNIGMVQRFLGDNDGGMMRLVALNDWITGNFYEFVDLFSPSVLKVSLQEIQIHLSGEDVKTNYIAKLRDRPDAYPAWKNDGSLLFPADEEAPKTLEQITDIGRNIGMGGMYVYMKDWETDNAAIRLMDYLLTDTAKHGVDVLIVQPPFEHDTYDIMNRRAEYKEIPGRYATIVDALLAAHPGTAYCDMLDPRAIGCAPTEFMDSAHTLKSCARKVVNYCLQKVPQWGYAPHG